MSLIFFVFVALALLSAFIGFVILELRPGWRRSPYNVFIFVLFALVCAGSGWAGLYYLSGRGTMIFDGIMDVVVLFLCITIGIVGGGTLGIKIFGRH